MSKTLGAFPVDSAALANIKHALGGFTDISEDGTRALVGADFTLNQLLDFYSGYNPERSVLIGYEGITPIYELLDPVYSEADLIRALVDEVERLRSSPAGDHEGVDE